jgi:hypothetical protein
MRRNARLIETLRRNSSTVDSTIINGRLGHIMMKSVSLFTCDVTDVL